MRTYVLYVKVDGTWPQSGTIHANALRSAISHLKPEHYDKPIRVEQEEEEGPGGMDEAAAG